MRKFHILVICILICTLVGGLDADGLEGLEYESDEGSQGTDQPVTTSPTRGRMRKVFTRSTTQNSHSEYGGLNADEIEDLYYYTEDWSGETGKPLTTSTTRGRMRKVFTRSTTHNTYWKNDATSTEPAVLEPGNEKWHVVRSGDTAYNIALTNGITLAQLRALNPGRGTMEMIYPGERIALPGGSAFPVSSASIGSGSAENGKWHTVQSGDTAYNVALTNGMTLDQLRKLNPGRGTMEMINPGDRIALG
ncbi:hypothetical protein BV898_13389 [Hypsibius exemplaris]|uniref:LysM domain-containing protein n=1 Tax=Hypsibius exemplaris TaxID=2072580 RepID=A0A1W0WAY9_HYPEX|nr:hypothetical protein BV898_13389 [Hypsibius exemplaris]